MTTLPPIILILLIIIPTFGYCQNDSYVMPPMDTYKDQLPDPINSWQSKTKYYCKSNENNCFNYKCLEWDCGNAEAPFKGLNSCICKRFNCDPIPCGGNIRNTTQISATMQPDILHYRKKPSIFEKWIKMMIKAILKFGKDFCNTTSMHGFNHISAPKRHWFERLLWICGTGLAIWGALDISLGQLQRFYENPTVVALEKDFRTWRFNFPAVTVCFDNRLDLAKLPAVIQKFWSVSPPDDKYEYYTRLVNAVASSNLLHLEKFQEFKDLGEDLDMFKIAVSVMPEAHIKTITSEVGNFKWIPVMTEAGGCYVTNSVAFTDTAIVKPSPNDSFTAVSCKYSSLSCYIILDVTSSARLYYHSPYDVMDITNTFSYSFLTLTRSTELSIMETRCGRGVKDLKPSRRGCLYNDEPTSTGRKVYSTNTCRISCRSRLAMKLCGCIPFYYFYEVGPRCTPAGMACLANFATQLASNNGEKCACAPQCIDSVFREISTTDQIWDKTPFNTRGSVKFTVQAPRTRYTREIVFHFQDLVVSFGGAAGLFLGASFLSFVEIFYFVLARIGRCFKKYENKPPMKVRVLRSLPEEIRIRELTAILEAQKHFSEYRTQMYN